MMTNRSTSLSAEQLAGDLLTPLPYENETERQSRLVATSVLSFGTKRHNSSGMEFRMEIVDDQIDVTCRAILGLTVACAKCHDHKFDPISTQEYYSLAGIFLSTEPLYGTIRQKYSNTPTELLPYGPNAQSQHEALVAFTEQLAAAKKPRDEKKSNVTKPKKRRRKPRRNTNPLSNSSRNPKLTKRTLRNWRSNSNRRPTRSQNQTRNSTD